ncbi:hypothetical protein RJ639_039617 [Escallonia herrerae]|uniref:Retrotransposon gag domain-containing protein n=1 Tax=Escallonia herrerae TaxID=1293975 RepID=A0AA88WIS3_9ASTE|nr:hypothetical protein RJ639_039617 [Escallonia herrerae]
MLEPRSYDGTREARQVDNLFWHLERYFEALDIDDEKEKVQTVVMFLNDTAALRWRRRYTDGCDVKMKKGSIREYVKEYSALMLKIPEMSERQRLCFFIDGLQQWFATELRRREPHDLASSMVIVERLGEFKQCERPRSPRHERVKDWGDGRSKSGSPKATDDEWSGDEGRHHHKEEKKHEGSRKHGDSCDHKARVGPRGGCFYYAGPHYRRDCPHKGKMIAFLEKHKSSKGNSSSSDGEARMGTLQMVNAFVQKSKEETAKEKKSKKRWGLLYATVDVVGKTQEALVDIGATHNFVSCRVAEWLRLKSTKDESWFTAVNAEERPMKGVIKNVDLRTGEWTGKADFNITDMDELGVVLGMDFMEKSSTTLNPYCGVMMMTGKEGQLKWMIPLVSKDGANTCKGITVLQLDKGSTLCYGERQMGPRTYAVDMRTKTVTTEKGCKVEYIKKALKTLHFSHEVAAADSEGSHVRAVENSLMEMECRKPGFSEVYVTRLLEGLASSKESSLRDLQEAAARVSKRVSEQTDNKTAEAHSKKKQQNKEVHSNANMNPLARWQGQVSRDLNPT